MNKKLPNVYKKSAFNRKMKDLGNFSKIVQICGQLGQ